MRNAELGGRVRSCRVKPGRTKSNQNFKRIAPDQSGSKCSAAKVEWTIPRFAKARLCRLSVGDTAEFHSALRSKNRAVHGRPRKLRRAKEADAPNESGRVQPRRTKSNQNFKWIAPDHSGSKCSAAK